MSKDIGKHQRTVIKENIKDILLGKTKAGNNVFINQDVPQWDDDDELPALLIYNRSEENTEWGQAPRTLKRIAEIVIEIVAGGIDSESVDLELDEISLEVERLMAQDDTIKGSAEDTILSRTEFEYIPDGALTFGSARLIFSVMYLTDVFQTFKEGDLKGIDTEWQTGHDNSSPDGIKDAEDEINF